MHRCQTRQRNTCAFFALSPLRVQNRAVRRAVPEYADNELLTRAIDPNGRDKGDISLGDRFSVGDSLRTRDTTAEVRLEPNGTILKIGPDTTFRFDTFNSGIGSKANEFSVYSGKVRFVAARHVYEDRIIV